MSDNSTSNGNAGRLLILRGPPGSGKTTMAQARFKNWTIVSANDFFVDENGKFRFEREDLQAAHDWCFRGVRDALLRGEDVVLDNCNRTIKEFARYFELESKEVRVYRLRSQFKNIHNAPQFSIDMFDKDYRPVKGEIDVRYYQDVDKIFFIR